MIGNHMVTSVQGQAYSCALHYLKAVEAIGVARAKASGLEVVEAMKRLPTDDDVHGPGWCGRMAGSCTRPTCWRPSSPPRAEVTWDLLKLIATTPAEQAFRPIADGGCPFLKS